MGSDDGLLNAFSAAGCGQAVCQPLWKGIATSEKAAVLSGPAIAIGVVYAGENNGQILAYNAKGCGQSICSPLWTGLIHNEPIVSSSPAVVNGTVYVGSANQLEPPIGRLYPYKLPRR